MSGRSIPTKELSTIIEYIDEDDDILEEFFEFWGDYQHNDMFLTF